MALILQGFKYRRGDEKFNKHIKLGDKGNNKICTMFTCVTKIGVEFRTQKLL